MSRLLPLLVVCLFLGNTGCRLLNFKNRSASGPAAVPGGSDSAIRERSDITAPRDLRLSVLGFNEILVSWTDTSAAETGFRLERSSDNGSSYSVSLNIHENFTQYRDENVLPNTTYRYRLSAFNASGFSAYVYADATTPSEPAVGLSAPVFTSATALSDDRVRLIWTDANAIEEGFRIERKVGSGAFAEVARVAANAGLAYDINLSAGTTYRYRICAYDSRGDGPWSGELTATTYLTPLAAPTNLAGAVLSSSSIRLRWRDNSNNEEGFRVERSQDGINFVLVGSPLVNDEQFDDTALQSGVAYTYRVYAVLGAQESAFSNSLSITIGSGLQAPTGLVATAIGESEIRLAWVENSPVETGVAVERSADGITFEALASLPASSNAHADTGLAAGTTYYYRARVYDSEYFSTYSNIAFATTAAASSQGGGEELEAPTNLVATAQSSSVIQLSWTDHSGASAAFQIERHKLNEPFALITTVNAGVTSFSDSGLSASTLYVYRVRAVEGALTSEYSDEASASTPAEEATPETPVLSGVAISSREVSLSWATSGIGTSSFRLERAEGAGPFLLLATPGAALRAYLDETALPTRTYRYRIFGASASVFSNSSNEVSATTFADADLPTAPSNLRGAVLTAVSIRLDWTNNGAFPVIVYRATGGGAFAEVTRLTGSTYTDSVSINTTYRYKVRSYNGPMHSLTYSNTVTVTTPAVANDNSAPTDLRGAAATNPAPQINLYWVDNSATETGFVIRATAPNNSYVDTEVGANVTAHTFTSGFAPGTSYRFEVFASFAGVLSSPSNAVTIVAPTGMSSGVRLNQITGLQATQDYSSSQINVSWNDVNHSPNEVNIKLEYYDFSNWYTYILPANATSYQHTGLRPQSLRYYRVTAVAANQADNSFPSDQVAGMTTTERLPAPILDTAVMPGMAGELTLTWYHSPPAPNSVSGYRVERYEGGMWLPVGQTGPEVLTFTDTGLRGATSYRYQVIALANWPYTDSLPSNEATGWTRATAQLTFTGGSNGSSFTSLVGQVSTSSTFTLGNMSNERAIIGMSWGPFAPFIVESNTCTNGKVMDYGSTCQVTIKCQPSQVGTVSSNFSVDFSTGHATSSAYVTCTGMQPPSP